MSESTPATECSHPAWTHIGMARYCASCGIDRDDVLDEAASRLVESHGAASMDEARAVILSEQA